jgi:hypothetical protein
MAENIAEAGSNKVICRGSTAYRIFSLTSLYEASYNNNDSTTNPAEKQGQERYKSLLFNALREIIERLDAAGYYEGRVFTI